jgi:hypothetical protein
MKSYKKGFTYKLMCKNSYIQTRTYNIVLNNEFTYKFMCVNLNNTNLYIQIHTNLQLADNEKNLKSSEKRAPPLA